MDRHLAELNAAMSDAARQQRAAQLLVREAARTFEAAELRRMESRGHRFNLARAINAMLTPDGLQDGLEGEVCREIAGTVYDPRRPVIPWSVLSRDLQVAGTGAYLVGTETPDAIDVLRPWSVTLQAGVLGLPGLRENVALPRTTASSTGYWLADESAAITPSQPTLGAVNLTPKVAGALISFTRLLNLQVASLDAYLRRELLRTVGTLIDAAVLNGAGTDGAPTGILNTPNINTQSGTALAWAGICNMLEQVALDNATDANIRFIGTPGVRELLQQREQASGSGLVWQGNEIAGKPAAVTTDMPSGTLLAGDFSQCTLGIWGAGIEIAINPYQTFNTGTVAMRAMVGADVGVLHAGAFCAATSVT